MSRSKPYEQFDGLKRRLVSISSRVSTHRSLTRCVACVFGVDRRRELTTSVHCRFVVVDKTNAPVTPIVWGNRAWPDAVRASASRRTTTVNIVDDTRMVVRGRRRMAVRGATTVVGTVKIVGSRRIRGQPTLCRDHDDPTLGTNIWHRSHTFHNLPHSFCDTRCLEKNSCKSFNRFIIDG